MRQLVILILVAATGIVAYLFRAELPTGLVAGLVGEAPIEAAPPPPVPPTVTVAVMNG